MKPAQTPHGTIGWIIKRSDYLFVQSGQRWATPYFSIHIRPHAASAETAWRIGFTTSRKVGSAVVRNRARRRLRELVRHHLAAFMKPGYDVVLVGRTAAASAPFDALAQALQDSIKRLKVSRDG
jgi:ribonuclease P protein component